jgi:hypothetical protein
LTSTSRQRRGGRLAAALSLVAVLAAGCSGADDGAAAGSEQPSGAADASSDTFTNPVLDTDYPDPDIVRDGDTWYSYATGQLGQQRHPGVLVHRPGDLVRAGGRPALPPGLAAVRRRLDLGARRQ